jgi:hypothetical protein
MLLQHVAAIMVFVHRLEIPGNGEVEVVFAFVNGFRIGSSRYGGGFLRRQSHAPLLRFQSMCARAINYIAPKHFRIV